MNKQTRTVSKLKLGTKQLKLYQLVTMKLLNFLVEQWPTQVVKNGGHSIVKKYKEGGKCDLCKHMLEKECIESFHFGTFSKIHGNLSHDQFSSNEETKRWYIYCIEDVPCHKKIIGSTTDPAARWRTHKSTCNGKNSNSTGLSKHFKEGCPNDTGKEKETLDFTLIDYYDTSASKLLKANHEPGPSCRCSECGQLKLLEDKWIIRLGTFYDHGLNSRNEIKSKARGNWN